MDRVKIACKMALIGIEMKKLMQCTELVADYLQDDAFDEVSLEAIKDALNVISHTASEIEDKANSTWLDANKAQEKLTKEAEADETL